MERRRVRSEDLAALFELHREAYKHHVEQIWGSWDDAWQRANFEEECAQSTCEVLLDGDQVIGYLQLVEEPHQVRLWNIVIRASHRGRSIGASVIRELQELAAAKSIAVTLRVFPSNEGARRFYVRLGFREVSRNAEAIEMAWERTQPLLKLESD